MFVVCASGKQNANTPFNASFVSKRATTDKAKVAKVVERMRTAQEAKKKKRDADIKNTIEALDKIARDEVEQLKDLLAPGSSDSGYQSDSEFYKELDDVIVFKEDDE